METRKVVKVHSCFQVKKGFEKDTPLSPKKCRCRQFIPAGEAAAFVDRGLAQYIIVGEQITETDDICNLCGGVEALKKACERCGKTGRFIKKTVTLVRGEDIIFISLDGKKNPKTTQVKKSPTLEKAHLERAWVNGNKIEQARIEIYGQLNREALASLISGFEPPDDQETWTGRRYDFGRGI